MLKLELGQKRSHETRGQRRYAWRAEDHHHLSRERGLLWGVFFLSLFLGMAWLSVWMDPQWGWVSSLCFLVVGILYLWTHWDGHKEHEIVFYDYGFCVDDGHFFAWEEVTGYWFLYDDYIRAVNIELRHRSQTLKIQLQLGDLDPGEVRSELGRFGITELENKKESLLDLWGRAFKL